MGLRKVCREAFRRANHKVRAHSAVLGASCAGHNLRDGRVFMDHDTESLARERETLGQLRRLDARRVRVPDATCGARYGDASSRFFGRQELRIRHRPFGF
jgi:hypothetical protein